MNLSKNVKISRVMNAVAAGTGDTQKGAILDMANYDGVLFIAALGDVAATAVGTLQVAGGAENDTSKVAALSGSAGTGTATATSADNKLMVLDVYKPTQRYIEVQLKRETANIAIDGIIAIRYQSTAGGKKPFAADATILAASLLTSPGDA